MKEAEELRALQQPEPAARIVGGEDAGKDGASGDCSSDWYRRWRTVMEGFSPTRRLPILTWIRRYDGEDALSDLIAGVTLGLTMIPQSIAYATIAGLPSQYGLYAAFMGSRLFHPLGSLAYVCFGTVREVSIGPTSLMALLTLEYTAGRPVQYVIVLAFTAGLVELVMGAFQLGFLVCLISAPVTSAFTSATALIIIGAQLGNLLGLPRLSAPGDAGFFATIWRLVPRLPDSAVGDTLLGSGCIVALLALQHLPRLVPAARSRRLHRALWYVSLARNALVVLLSALLAHQLSVVGGADGVPFRLSGKVEPGIPGFEWPVQGATVTDGGTNRTVSFLEITGELGSGLLLVPLVAVLANVAIAKAFASDGAVDATQELIALGLCNVIGACFRAMPTTGAFTRSAVSHASGVRTPLSGLYSALLTLLALGVLTPYFYYIPRATLAAVLIVAVVSMLDLTIVRRLPRPDLLAWTVCFAVCLVRGVEVGLLGGMAVSLLDPLRHWIAGRTTVQDVPPDAHPAYRRLRPELGLLYPGVDRLRSTVLAEARRQPQLPLVLDCERLVALDYSAMRALRELADEVARCGPAPLLLHNVQPAWRRALELHETDQGLVFRRSEGDAT
uniref:SLC26A/SulP transporter domain-containing protein n=1 Tax=Anopheles epiroticus TaxID=199890 RepID=A0A182P7M5_9DIPT